ncbi:MAG: HNH endonuclease signature motif containing protein [Nitrosopumilaceae archaeon]
MKRITLILGLFLISIIIQVEGQTNPALEDYCKKNWREAPDMCSDFIPEGYYDEKATKQFTQEDQLKLEQIQREAEQKANFGDLDCPAGTYYGRDNAGNVVCRSIETNEIINPSTNVSFDNTYIIVGISVVIIIIIIAVVKSSGKPSEVTYPEKEYIERRPFSKTTKEQAKERQHGRCANCDCYPTHWEFDHVGRRDDNSLGNCQGLCRDCHQDKTLRENR